MAEKNLNESSMYEAGRRSFWKDTPGSAENQRLEFELLEPTDEFYNEVWYEKYENRSSYLNCAKEDYNSKRFDYVEESYVDNSEAFSDTLPPGYKTEHGGFYVNTGELKLVPLCPPPEKIKMVEKKKKSTEMKDGKKPKISARQKSIIKELKKLKLENFIQKKLQPNVAPEEPKRCVNQECKNTCENVSAPLK